MSYSVEFAGPVARYLARLDANTQRRFEEAIRTLTDEPLGRHTKALRGRNERSLRVGGWRILYTVDSSAGLIFIRSIAPRGQVYR